MWKYLKSKTIKNKLFLNSCVNSKSISGREKKSCKHFFKKVWFKNKSNLHNTYNIALKLFLKCYLGTSEQKRKNPFFLKQSYSKIWNRGKNLNSCGEFVLSKYYLTFIVNAFSYMFKCTGTQENSVSAKKNETLLE